MPPKFYYWSSCKTPEQVAGCVAISHLASHLCVFLMSWNLNKNSLVCVSAPVKDSIAHSIGWTLGLTVLANISLVKGADSGNRRYFW